jgi:hypothetical protein
VRVARHFSVGYGIKRRVPQRLLKGVALVILQPSLRDSFFFRLACVKVVLKSLAFLANVFVNDLPLERPTN